MYGTLLDQRVFESLVEKTMPIIWDHLVKNDVQLSVVSLPWFLSLYINSMPLIFAFRVLDVFFLEGPKVLFQVGLAILRINGEELLDATDDGTFISVLKSYFARLGESAHPTSENPKHRAITNFQALMVVAFKEFEGITQHTISEQRSKHKDAVLQNIESFAKRTSIRNLGPESKKLSPNDLGFLYDKFYSILYERQQRAQVLQAESDRRARVARQRASELVTGVPGNVPEMGRVALGASSTTMDYDAFREFLAGVSKWAITDSPSSPNKDDKGANGYFSRKLVHVSPWGTGPEPTDHDFMHRLFRKWDVDECGALTLQHVVMGLAPIKGNRDIMANISYFFELYDDDKDGRVDREGILRISEALLFLSRRGLSGDVHGQHEPVEPGPDGIPLSRDERFLSAVSAFIRRCFEYADPDHPSRHGNAEADVNEAAEAVGDIKLSEDSEDEDLLVDEKELQATAPQPIEGGEEESSNSPTATSAADNSLLARPSHNSFGQTQPKHVDKNAALDPSSPVHITLPTFRMLVLADESLESFFDSGFANSFHLADAPLPSSTLTSLNGLPGPAQQHPPHPPVPAFGLAGPAAGVVAPGKGLRGMLDNIVTDGMRVAAEVRRRMDEAQKELDRGATTRGTAEDDDDDDDGEEHARDLLDVAEADAGVGAAGQKSLDAGSDGKVGPEEGSLLDRPVVETSSPPGSSSDAVAAAQAGEAERAKSSDE
jgi:hypothetical protein